ncbi:hypothetical protein EPA93_03195 [Ktedonosporobacter rubrisoli]|uniref:DUF2269 family protein n=1 Tax=Ktedonosporobacter rubrisoli TaxID=2509675 RepID=A0A4P6JJF2_KTERU|nr:hypothetical protein [Ktedonosporobacter rubrisoli]QBD75052.1 hypothetical protein EPA93_03195 [Ktedonosporobacter rubrisoli]
MPKKMTIRQKRWLLSAHILCSVAWLGAATCSLILNLAVLFTNDAHLLNAAYIFVGTLDKALLRGGALGAIISGVLLSVFTKWGLFRFYWIIVKEAISLLCMIIGVIISGWNDEAILLTAQYGLHAMHNQLYLTNQTMIFIGITFQLISLSAVFVISIFKPWGQLGNSATASKAKAGKQTILR